MADFLIELAYQLTRAGQPFVQATVAWCERPTSAKAIIQADGRFTGCCSACKREFAREPERFLHKIF